MAACKQCGADASGIACDFCGAIQSPPRTLEDELEVLQAIAKAAQHVASNVDAGTASSGNALQDMAMANQRARLTSQLADAKLAAFWGSAWLPTQPDALIQAAQSALAGIRVSDGIDAATESAALTEALLARTGAAMDALELRSPSDARVGVLRRKLQEKRDALAAAQKASRKKSSMLLGGLLLPLIVVFIWIFSMSAGSDDPVPVSMQGEWVITPDQKELEDADHAVIQCKAGKDFWCQRGGAGNAASRLVVTPGGMTFKGWKDDPDTVSVVHNGQGGDGPQDDGSYKFRSGDPKCSGTLALAPDGKLMVSLSGDSECSGFAQTWLRKK
jgi:hypothetical protein